MKRLMWIALISLSTSKAMSGADGRVALEVNVFQGFRARTTAMPSAGSVVYLPPDPGWSDDIEHQRTQITDTLGFDGVSVLLIGRFVGAYGATQRITTSSIVYGDGDAAKQPVTVTIRPTRTGDRGVLLEVRLLLGASKEIAAASVSGELGKTFILGGKPGGNPLFVAVTPNVETRQLAPVEAFTVSDEIQPPRLQTRVDPLYPEALHRARKSGLVLIQAIVNTDGSVGPASVVRHSDPEFDESALSAVRQWHYQPAVLDGAPVRVYLTMVVSFRM